MTTIFCGVDLFKKMQNIWFHFHYILYFLLTYVHLFTRIIYNWFVIEHIHEDTPMTCVHELWMSIRTQMARYFYIKCP